MCEGFSFAYCPTNEIGATMAPMIEDAIRIIDYTWVSKKKG